MPALSVASPPGYRLVIGSGTIPQISMVRSPYLSLVSLMVDAAARARPGGAWPDRRAGNRSRPSGRVLPYGAGFALKPGGRGPSATARSWFDAVLPDPPAGPGM